ncbi:MAG TPA: methyltransferase domain-containing protein [Bryobacteraceae bacterium]|nr:methyltransferase domain-containing protein [Bryobacteraceae bacterium]
MRRLDLSNYDPIARVYAEQIYHELRDKPFDREILDRFAQRVRGLGRVCDLGCGPGQVARYLRNRGVDVFGLDLSSGMLAEAKRLNPDIAFAQGDMHALGIRSDALGGIAAFYSIIHARRDRVAAVLYEMQRVLRDGGLLLIAFHLGTDAIHATDFHGQAVDLEATLFTNEEMTGYLQAPGFSIEEALERAPYPDVEYQSQRGYILAAKRQKAA